MNIARYKFLHINKALKLYCSSLAEDKIGTFRFCYLDINNLSGMEFFNICLGS